MRKIPVVSYVVSGIVAFTLISGCSSTYEQKSMVAPSVKLNPGQGVLVSVPADGKYETKLYSGSGQMTADAVSAAFQKHAKTVDVTSKCHGANCLTQIDASKYGYYVQPDILHWEDRATEWSGRSDRVEIKIIVFDAKTRKELANTSFTGKSKWMTFGGDHPQDLLPEPTGQYVDSLYQ